MRCTKLKPYSEAYQYLCKFTDYERMAKVNYSQTAYNLKRMKWLLQALGNPHDKLRCIHIAGTKGKGSTAIMLATILAQAGYQVGIYTSPHLVDMRERIQVWHNGKQNLISKNDFTKLMNHITNGLNRQNLNPTFFELMTALGFLHFARQGVDFAVIEVGLGGRLDATNLITPIASVITRIDFDHMDKLGYTLNEIAREKAGIIKAGVPTISFRQKTAADKVIRSIAINNKAPLYLANILRHNLPVQGAHQSENWSLALKTIEVINKRGITDIGPAIIKSALKRLELPGRIELVSSQPDIIIDSAHNAVSIKATTDTVSRLPAKGGSASPASPRRSRGRAGGKYHKVILIFALSADKEIGKIISSVITMADIIIFTRTSHPRLMDPEGFVRYLPNDSNKTFLIEPDYTKALSMARRLAQADDLIIITGSFYLAGPVRELLATKTPRHEGHNPLISS